MSDQLHNLRQQAIENTNFRKVLDTGRNTQVVAMSIAVGEDIGSEVHPENEQILINIQGQGKSVVDGVEYPFEENDLVVVRPGTRHNFINTGDSPLKIITIYSPPHHPDGTVHETKSDAQRAEND